MKIKKNVLKFRSDVGPFSTVSNTFLMILDQTMAFLFAKGQEVSKENFDVFTSHTYLQP